MRNKYLIFSEPFTKKHWLKKQTTNHVFQNVTFKNGWMPLTEVKNSYPFFIYQHFSLKPDLSKRFIPYFDYIDVEKLYHSTALIQLQTIKKALIKADMVKSFALDDYQIIQLDGSYIPRFIKINESKFSIDSINTMVDVYQTKDVTEQVYAVFEKIVSLLNQGVDIETIKIINTSPDDDYSLMKLCHDAGIPLNVTKPRSIRMYPVYQTIKSLIVNEGLAAVKAYIENLKKSQPKLANNLIHLFNKFQDQLIINHQEVFLTELEQLKIQPDKLKKAVEVMSIEDISDFNHHYLLMNYIDELFPQKKVDNDYLTNEEKKVIQYPTTNEENQYRAMIYKNLLDGLTHVTIFYPQKLVDETRIADLHLTRKLNIIPYQYEVKDISYLRNDDTLRYGRLKYLYNQYQITLNDYPLLKTTYEKDLPKFNHQFKGIYKADLDHLLNQKFSLTGAKIEKLNLCPFQYFLNYILKLDDVEPTHYIYFGNQIHHALENLVKDPNFDYKQMVIESDGFPEEIEFKKSIYQKLLIDNIEKIYAVVKDFHNQSSYQQIFTESTLSKKINPSDRFTLNGIIDKLMIDKEKGYYAIIDYKFSGKTFSIREFEQGLRLQLPFYLYLYGANSELKPSGLFFRKTGLDKEKSADDLDVKMQGVFLDDESQMRRLDPKANHIKGLRYKSNEGLYSSSRALSETDFEQMMQTMEKMIYQAAKQIESGDFKIEPKLSIQNQHQSVSCQYCPFSHICYSKNKLIKEA